MVDHTRLEHLLLEDAERALEARRGELGAELFAQVVLAIRIRVLDWHWRKHLQELDDELDGIDRHTLGDDDLKAYRQRASSRFQERQEQIADQTAAYIFSARIEVAGQS